MGKCRGLFLVVVAIACAGASAPALAVTNTDKKQNKAIKELKQGAEALTAGVEAATAGLESVTTSVTQLDAEVTQVDAALTALDGLFNGYVDSTEYGIVTLYFDAEGNGFEANDAVPGQMLTSADIPDSGDQSTVTGTMVVLVPDGTTAKPLALKAGIRSGESDGTCPADPVGQAGLMSMSAVIIGAPGTTSVGGGNPGATQLPLTSAPNGSLGGLPVYDIPGKAPLSGAAAGPLTFPDDQMIELTNPANLQTLTGRRRAALR